MRLQAARTALAEAAPPELCSGVVEELGHSSILLMTIHQELDAMHKWVGRGERAVEGRARSVVPRTRFIGGSAFLRQPQLLLCAACRRLVKMRQTLRAAFPELEQQQQAEQQQQRQQAEQQQQHQQAEQQLQQQHPSAALEGD